MPDACDGLKLLRVDEIYGSTLSESGPWRTLEISTHQPGRRRAALAKDPLSGLE